MVLQCYYRGFTEKPNIEGTDKDSKKKSAKNWKTLLNLVINVFI